MIEFQGEEDFDVAAGEVLIALTDLRVVERTLPDVRNCRQVNDRTLACQATPSLGFLRGGMDVRVEIVEARGDEFAVSRMEASGPGLSFTVRNDVRLESIGGGCRARWRSRIENLGGMIGRFTPGLVESAARDMITRTWVNVRREARRLADA